MSTSQTNTNKYILIIPLLILAMISGAFGNLAVGFVSQNFKIFADNILSTGYGCGTFGQSEPNYGTACTTATSIIIPGSSVSSSSNPTILLSSSLTSSSLVSSSVSSSSSATLSVSSSQISSSISSTLSSSSNTVSSNVSNPTLSVKINLSANYNNVTKQMDNNFRIRNMIPLAQPYNQLPFNYSGLEIYSSKANIPTDAVDWVLIEIKDTNKVSVFTKAAIVKQNGNIVDVNGSQNLALNGFNPTQGYNYEVVVRHQNAIAIATNQNINFIPNTNTIIDFTKNINVRASNQEQIGTDVQNQAVFGMRKANSNGSDSIDAQDRNIVLNTQESDGIYNSFDLNLDGVVDAQDRNLILSAQEATENI